MQTLPDANAQFVALETTRREREPAAKRSEGFETERTGGPEINMTRGMRSLAALMFHLQIEC
jgi:hypothetical protein